MYALYQILPKSLGIDAYNTSLLLFRAVPLYHSLTITLLRIGVIISPQLHPAPLLPFTASLIMGSQHPVLELESKLCLFLHPLSIHALSLSTWWFSAFFQQNAACREGCCMKHEAGRGIYWICEKSKWGRDSDGSQDLKCTVAGGKGDFSASPAVKSWEDSGSPEISGLMMGGITKGARKIPVCFYSLWSSPYHILETL